jgi:hypothetical protein
MTADVMGGVEAVIVVSVMTVANEVTAVVTASLATIGML